MRRNLGRLLAACGVVVAATAGGIAALPVPAGAAKAPKPSITELVATPSTITTAGATTTITATVANATTCSLSSSPVALSGSGSVTCAGGSVSQVVAFALNTAAKKAAKYKVTLTATGPNGSKSKNVTVKVDAGAGGGSQPGKVSLASDGSGFCAVLPSGGIDCWGDNEYDQLGNGTTGGPDGAGGYDSPQAVTGITNAASVASDGSGYCAVLSSGGVDCWGGNGDGQIGNGTVGGPDGNNYFDTPQAVTGITNAVSVASDVDGYCAVLSSGGIDCWGYNYSGQLGIGTTGGPAVGGYDTPQAVTGITNAVSVTGDDDYYGYCAVLSSGGIDCWGDNSAGQLGNGTVGGPDGAGGYDTPQAVTGITNALSVASDSAVHRHAPGYCAVLSSGGIDCWGYNDYGQLGNGTTGGTDGAGGYDSPQAVTGITNAVSAADDGYGFCAVLSSGGIDCWGYNYSGQLGNGTTGGPDGAYGYDTPQAVTGITNAVSATSDGGGDGYCAVLSSGGIDCWAANYSGELGNGTVGGPDGAYGYDSPQAVTGITNAVSVTGDSNYDGYCTVLSSGGIDCWGDNAIGDLGNGTIGGTDGLHGYDTPQAVVTS